mmetsp:Transcript_87484/g.237012  ORF Transcript_87484/g.237012 Transcript_87484/m.237012 type:complete len:334 (+) Transcript_87484:1-1002(+)
MKTPKGMLVMSLLFALNHFLLIKRCCHRLLEPCRSHGDILLERCHATCAQRTVASIDSVVGGGAARGAAVVEFPELGALLHAQLQLPRVKVRGEGPRREGDRRDPPTLQQLAVDLELLAHRKGRCAIVQQRERGPVVKQPGYAKPLLLACRQQLLPRPPREPALGFVQEQTLEAQGAEAEPHPGEARLRPEPLAATVAEALASNNLATGLPELTLERNATDDPILGSGHCSQDLVQGSERHHGSPRGPARGSTSFRRRRQQPAAHRPQRPEVLQQRCLGDAGGNTDVLDSDLEGRSRRPTQHRGVCQLRHQAPAEGEVRGLGHGHQQLRWGPR